MRVQTANLISLELPRVTGGAGLAPMTSLAATEVIFTVELND